jgi:hypothetical protein
MSRRQPDTERLDWCDLFMAQGPGCTIQIKALPTGKILLTWTDGASGGELAYIGGGMREVIDRAIQEAAQAAQAEREAGIG